MGAEENLTFFVCAVCGGTFRYGRGKVGVQKELQKMMPDSEVRMACHECHSKLKAQAAGDD